VAGLWRPRLSTTQGRLRGVRPAGSDASGRKPRQLGRVSVLLWRKGQHASAYRRPSLGTACERLADHASCFAARAIVLIRQHSKKLSSCHATSISPWTGRLLRRCPSWRVHAILSGRGGVRLRVQRWRARQEEAQLVECERWPEEQRARFASPTAIGWIWRLRFPRHWRRLVRQPHGSLAGGDWRDECVDDCRRWYVFMPFAVVRPLLTCAQIRSGTTSGSHLFCSTNS
jgi:hypothetical protein